jgi:hypothetical protein
MNRTILLPLAVVIATACATPRPRWMPAGKDDASYGQGFSVQAPPGWMRLGSEDSVLMTRDGPLLQRIAVTRSDVGKPLANTKKVLSVGMLPQEAAEVVAEELSSSQVLGHAKLVENVPAVVGGIPGFRLTVAYEDRDGLRYRLVVYGAVTGTSFYRLSYAAPERHYYELDRGTFEGVVRSFRPGRPAASLPGA